LSTTLLTEMTGISLHTEMSSDFSVYEPIYPGKHFPLLTKNVGEKPTGFVRTKVSDKKFEC
jgi:hypothetical protein